ncbi:hypothetical protein ACFSX9_02450 [Flavobacterium ardleyense]|uniref:WD40-like Beta Propeller Repeat n=1 Tax=Flavobacterium ardleyense TaxID=2038737 RepID=A0ABW5Z4M2_9FLAO
MKKATFTLILILLSNFLTAQNDNSISQFDEILNQFFNVRDFCISSDGKEAFFTIQSPNSEISQIAVMKKKNKGWLEPELLPFCDSYMYLEPFLASNGDRLFFVSNRPLDNSGTSKKDFDIWYVDRTSKDNKWSEPKNIGKPVNSELDEFYPSVSDNNNLYFTMESPNGFGKDDIYFSKWEDGSYLPPVILNENINSSGYEFNAFISKKEDFILFTKYNEEGGQGSGDLYISKKDAEGNWQKATNLGVPINTKFMEYCPFYDEQNEILYFTSKRQNISARDFKNVADLKKHIMGNGNGLSKIYKTKIKL